MQQNQDFSQKCLECNGMMGKTFHYCYPTVLDCFSKDVDKLMEIYLWFFCWLHFFPHQNRQLSYLIFKYLFLQENRRKEKKNNRIHNTWMMMQKPADLHSVYTLFLTKFQNYLFYTWDVKAGVSSVKQNLFKFIKSRCRFDFLPTTCVYWQFLSSAST